MKCKIDDGVLVIEAESQSETEELQAWREAWHKEPKRDMWFKCLYYNPTQVLVV